VVDAAKAILDGHVVLSRRLAGAGHFPAIDVLQSVSRVMSDVVSPEHLALANAARDVLATYRESADLVEVGAYVRGTNPKLDHALTCIDALNAFLRQSPQERFTLSTTLELLARALGAPGEAARA
jgi:flagellum-specific ATP synthase